MADKKAMAKKFLEKTPVGAKIKFVKVIIILMIVAFFILPVIVMFLVSPGSDKGENQNVGCSVSGGNVEASGIKKFNQHAQGGALEGKGKEIQKIAEKHKVPPNIFMAIIASESMWGRGENATRQKNPLSVMGTQSIYDSTFPTIEDGLNAGAKNLYELYISKGLDSPKKIGPKYAPIGADNDPNNMNARWIPTVESIMKDLGGSEAKTTCSSGAGKAMKFNGKLPKWSNDNPGDNNLYTAGQCTWYAFGIRQKMGKPVSTYWHDAHKWNDRAKAEGYKVDKKPEPGALFIAEQGAGGHDSYYGHVAVVIGVSDGGQSFKISEMNWKGSFMVNERTLKMTDGYSFIHDKE
ncbi:MULTISPECIES: CHAP domain-containing protein [Staphylococcus]|uniref:Mannosyl-glycoprotein endo-beta-N-acetylglucosamidase n=1 Tax=Staphylococcus agnetis TaxID=985762 RepID=A0ABX3Z0G0_9STAP|nr:MULTISPECIES: CHAP domain-containing protein [Staphylococcus]ALN77495.1 CHAP domain-containing protein [Staphylococcus agnetis]MDG4943476.1 CHAP domain-containing protein [Staphylococcus agnetis]OSP14895.1 mannosyl-glycoprotein endo-beta-N-acetylglucosamidase [Staphylococcus agnetis]OSP22709.1 mannosyl-glycoprotein endo-beta-N-acetylglucosamidase [Staphylococcus agnetis]OTW30370.1 mannosyl-glycoprotein endo-beta-N-acetylglucosamidase [Staphylococcus agnetis]